MNLPWHGDALPFNHGSIPALPSWETQCRVHGEWEGMGTPSLDLEQAHPHPTTSPLHPGTSTQHPGPPCSQWLVPVTDAWQILGTTRQGLKNIN